MSFSHAALIVDSDPQGLEALVYGFQGADWRITACPSPEMAAVLVKASGAEMIVAASRARHEQTLAMLDQIRAKDTLKTLPILVLGPEDLRATTKEKGNVDLLPLPSFVRDVIMASQVLVATLSVASQQGHDASDEPAYETSTTPSTTLSLVRTMGGLSRSGLLQLSRNDRHGEILFHEGELTGAQVASLQGMSALQHLLLWTDGTMKLRLRTVARRGQLRHKARELADELERFQRDYHHAVRDIGPASTVYVKDEARLMSSTGEVPAEVTPVVRLCDGLRTLADIIDESPFRVLDTVRIVARLVDFGILRRRDAKPLGVADVVVPRTPLDEFWETARIVGQVMVHSAPQAHAGAPAAPVVVVDQREVQKPRREGERRNTGEALAVARRAGPIAGPVLQPAVESVPSRPVVANAPVQAARVPSPIPDAVLPHNPRGKDPPVQTTTEPARENKRAVAQASGSSAGGSGASGTIELRKSDRRSQPTMRGFIGRASVVIDIPTTEVPKSPAPATAVVPVVATSMPQTGKTSTPSAAASPVPAAPAKIATPPAPAASTKVATLAPPTTPAKAVAPAPAPKVAVPSPAPAPAPSSHGTDARVTGVLEVSASKRVGRPTASAAKISIQLDESLDQKPKVNAPAAVGAKPAPTDPRPPKSSPSPDAPARPRSKTPIVTPSAQSSPVSSPAAPRSRISSTMSLAPGSVGNRPSGSFSAVESDFFARESELYREEKTESFADLDDKRAKSKAKPAPSAKPEKKR
jgi:hypothetical protein